jgi:hypothetical protein
MIKLAAIAALALLLPLSQTAPLPARVGDGPRFTPDHKLEAPLNYREWIFLTSGLDMSYDKAAKADPKMSMFNNVFVNPEAYRVFQKTGLWPEGTAIVLEVRGAEGNHSINARGKTQTAEIMGFEVHVKDSAQNPFPGGWGFYSFDSSAPVARHPETDNCYSCHQDHAAVDTTFVQFYPTLQAAAKAHGTYSKAYQAEMGK